MGQERKGQQQQARLYCDLFVLATYLQILDESVDHFLGAAQGFAAYIVVGP